MIKFPGYGDKTAPDDFNGNGNLDCLSEAVSSVMRFPVRAAAHADVEAAVKDAILAKVPDFVRRACESDAVLSSTLGSAVRRKSNDVIFDNKMW